MKMHWTCVGALLLAFGTGQKPDVIRGDVVVLQAEHGSFVRYVPDRDIRGVVVVVHGTVGKAERAIDAALEFAQRWTELAEERGLVVIAPAFDDANFGGHAGPGGGYRGLFGRHVGADRFVNSLVDTARDELSIDEEQIYLYGHSAGGQFVSRYLVMHPGRVRGAVICAAGTFAFPDPEVAWTNGMAPLQRRMRWSDDEPWEAIEVIPDPRGWVQAAQIPVTVVVGAEDTGEVKEIPGNPGQTHVQRGRAWVQAMRNLARENKVRSRVAFRSVPGVGHDSAALTAACQQALFDERDD